MWIGRRRRRRRPVKKDSTPVRNFAIIVALLAAIGAAPSSAAHPHVSVYFVQGEQLAPVTRQGSGPLAAVRRLIAGPTRAEVARGFRRSGGSRPRIRL
jgi:hypothetical protein